MAKSNQEDDRKLHTVCTMCKETGDHRRYQCPLRKLMMYRKYHPSSHQGANAIHSSSIFGQNAPLNEKLVDLYQSQSGSIKFSAANGEDMSAVAEEEMAHLIMFVLNHPDGSVLLDLKQILVPIISFMFCDFWLLGFEAVGEFPCDYGHHDCQNARTSTNLFRILIFCSQKIIHQIP